MSQNADNRGSINPSSRLSQSENNFFLYCETFSRKTANPKIESRLTAYLIIDSLFGSGRTDTFEEFLLEIQIDIRVIGWTDTAYHRVARTHLKAKSAYIDLAITRKTFTQFNKRTSAGLGVNRDTSYPPPRDRGTLCSAFEIRCDSRKASTHPTLPTRRRPGSAARRIAAPPAPRPGTGRRRERDPRKCATGTGCRRRT